MNKISSEYTFLYKKTLLKVWFSFWLLFLIAMVLKGDENENLDNIIALTTAMILLGLVWVRMFYSALIDEVWDDGNSLIMKNKDESETIPYSNISNISYSSGNTTIGLGPAVLVIVTILLKTDSKFGSEISFVVPNNLLVYSSGSQFGDQQSSIEDLIERINKVSKN